MTINLNPYLAAKAISSCIDIRKLCIMDPLDELARIRGQIHALTPAPAPATVNMVEVEMMIDMAIREARKDWMREMEVLLSNFQPDHSLRSLVTDLQYQVKELQTQLTKPIDPSIGIPPVEEITKIRIQFWDNKANPPPVEYDRRGKPKRRTIPNHLLQLTIWTCHKSHMWKYAKGTCGQKYMPVYQPNTAYTRKRIGTKLDYLGVNESAQYIGCLTASKYGGGQFPDQAAVMSGTNHLWLNVRGDALDCGMPSTKKDDYKGNAPVFTWYYPDKNG